MWELKPLSFYEANMVTICLIIFAKKLDSLAAFQTQLRFGAVWKTKFTRLDLIGISMAGLSFQVVLL